VFIAKVEATAMNKSQIPEFAHPPPPKLEKQQVQSQKLQAVSQRTKDLVPLSAIQSLFCNPLFESAQCFEVPARCFSRRLRNSTARTKGGILKISSS
jgi:hypothetical protein